MGHIDRGWSDVVTMVNAGHMVHRWSYVVTMLIVNYILGAGFAP